MIILIHLLIVRLTICRRLLLFLHLDVTVVLLSCVSGVVGFFLILFGLAVPGLLLLFFLWWLRRWCVKNCVEFRLERVDLVFHLLDSVREVFILRFF